MAVGQVVPNLFAPEQTYNRESEHHNEDAPSTEVLDQPKLTADKTAAVEQEGERRLGEILQHPGRITEQLLTLRMIETLTVLDVLHYREHIFKLGQYDEGHDLLSLRPE